MQIVLPIRTNPKPPPCCQLPLLARLRVNMWPRSAPDAGGLAAPSARLAHPAGSVSKNRRLNSLNLNPSHCRAALSAKAVPSIPGPPRPTAENPISVAKPSVASWRWGLSPGRMQGCRKRLEDARRWSIPGIQAGWQDGRAGGAACRQMGASSIPWAWDRTAHARANSAFAEGG